MYKLSALLQERELHPFDKNARSVTIENPFSQNWIFK